MYIIHTFKMLNVLLHTITKSNGCSLWLQYEVLWFQVHGYILDHPGRLTALRPGFNYADNGLNRRGVAVSLLLNKITSLLDKLNKKLRQNLVFKQTCQILEISIQIKFSSC